MKYADDVNLTPSVRDDSHHAQTTISTKEIFRVMVANEVRAGRLNRANANRLARFACDYGVSSIEVERFLDEALSSRADQPERSASAPPRRSIRLDVMLWLAAVGAACCIFNQL